MPMRRHLTVEEASRAIGFLQTGLSQVGAQFNVSHTVIGQLWTRYQFKSDKFTRIYQEIIFLQLFRKIHGLKTTLKTAENQYQCSADSVSRTQCKHKKGVLDNIDY
jgi:predicted SprT family Zn-dependent metalloprotease